MKTIYSLLFAASLVSCTVSLQNSHSEGHGISEVREDLKQEVDTKLDIPKKL